MKHRVEAPLYQVAAYYFPNYHVDPRNAARYGPGWNEWELLRRAQPRFPDHKQPKVPLWGYEDERSYLEPDTIHGMAYLEAIRRTFG